MTDVLYIYLRTDRFSCRKNYIVHLYTIIELSFWMKMEKFWVFVVWCQSINLGESYVVSLSRKKYVKVFITWQNSDVAQNWFLANRSICLIIITGTYIVSIIILSRKSHTSLLSIISFGCVQEKKKKYYLFSSFLVAK